MGWKNDSPCWYCGADLRAIADKYGESSELFNNHMDMRCPEFPTREFMRYWIYAYMAPREIAPDNGIWSGKWLLFIPVQDIDETWQIIANEVMHGRLGYAAKTATMKENSNAASSDRKVICIYTKDCRDEDDVTRVLSRLRELGFTGRLYYKEDNATFAGQYGKGSASLYGSSSGTELVKRREIVPPDDRPEDPRLLGEE